MSEISMMAWISWVAIGLVMGLFVGKPVGGTRILALDMGMALVGGVAGGLGSAFGIGYGTPQLFIISDLSALFVSGGLLWIAGAVFVKMRR